MTSTAQLSANRCNAQNSTGPRSELGKQRSARNSTVVHGLTSEKLLALPNEDPAELRAFAEELRNDLAPEGALESGALWLLIPSAYSGTGYSTVDFQVLAGTYVQPSGSGGTGGTETWKWIGKVVLAVNSGTDRESWSSGTLSSTGDGGIINVSAFDGGEISVTVAGVPMRSTISDGGVASGTFTLDLEFSRQNLR